MLLTNRFGIGTRSGCDLWCDRWSHGGSTRSAYYFVTGKNGQMIFSIVRGEDGIREVTVDIAGTPVHAAVVSGLGNARNDGARQQRRGLL